MVKEESPSRQLVAFAVAGLVLPLAFRRLAKKLSAEELREVVLVSGKFVPTYLLMKYPAVRQLVQDVLHDHKDDLAAALVLFRLFPNFEGKSLTGPIAEFANALRDSVEDLEELMANPIDLKEFIK